MARYLDPPDGFSPRFPPNPRQHGLDLFLEPPYQSPVGGHRRWLGLDPGYFFWFS